MTLDDSSGLWTTYESAFRQPGWCTESMDSATDPTGPEVLVIDGANVVGSRPDGWWKDRSAAAARLHARLVGSPALAPRVVLVLEGRARGGVGEGSTGAVEVVHAQGEGDDTIVAVVARAAAAGHVVTVVTADRALARRAEELGATRRGPDWLLGQIAADG